MLLIACKLTIDDERSETGKLQIGPDNEKAVDAYHLALIARYAGNEVFTQLVESNGWIQVDPEVVKIAQNKPLATLVGAHA